MFDVRKHPTALVDATKAYAEATSSSVRFLIAENKHMAKELQSTRSAKAKTKMARLVEVLALETVTWRLYDRFVTVCTTQLPTYMVINSAAPR